MIETDAKLKSSVSPVEDRRNTSTSEIAGPIYFDTLQALAIFDSENVDIRTHSEPTSPRVVAYMQNADLLWQHSEVNLSLALMRQASNLESKNLTVLAPLAEKLERVGNLNEALAVRKAIAKIQPGFESFAQWAEVLYKMAEDQASLEKYYEALGLLNQECALLFSVYKNMGNILVRQGDFDGAEEFYNKAYTMNPDSDQLLVNLGTLEVQRQDFDKALFCFRKAVTLNPKNDKGWVGLALVHNQFGDQDLAWANLETAIESNAGNRTAVHIMASWSEKYQRRMQAIEALEEYLGQVECDEEMSLALIQLYCSCGNYAFAEIECERVLLWNPGHQEVKAVSRQIRKALRG